MMGEKDDETKMLASEIMRRLIEVKTAFILDKASETMDFISHLLRTENTELFKYYGEYRMPLQVYNINWKYNFYCLLKDKNRIPIAIDDLQLDEFVKWISTGIVMSRIQGIKINFCDIKSKLWILINKFSEMEHISYRTLYSKNYDKNKQIKLTKMQCRDSLP